MSITSTLVRGAEIRFQEAADVLRPHVGCFWTITAGHDAVLRIVPDGSAAISVELRDRGPVAWSLRGPLLGPDERTFASPATVVGVRLRPGVAFLLSGIAADVLVDRRIDLTKVSAFRDLTGTEPRPHTAAEHIATLERFLITRLQNAQLHPVVAAALRELEREHGCLQASELAARCGVSPRHLNRLMRPWVGYGAKRLATIVRFQATLHEMASAPAAPASLASEHGYFDQSHLTLDTVRFAGATPGTLASRATADFSKTRCADLL